MRHRFARWAFLFVVCLLFASVSSHAAGTATWTPVRAVDSQKDVLAYTVTWTSDASGNVSAHAAQVRGGQLAQVIFIPGAGGTQPTNGYNGHLVDAYGLDVLNGTGAALLNTGPVSLDSIGHWLDAGTTLDLQIDTAGNAKTGTVVIIVVRNP